MTEHADLLSLFIGLKDAHPDMFFENVEIKSVYGGFPGSKLCGGRNNVGQQMGLSDVRRLVERYNEHGVACNVTFTNQLADEALIEEDSYSRGLLEVLAAGEGNGVIVCADPLAGYIAHEFPSLARVLSTTAALETPEEHAAALCSFDRVVLNYEFAHDRAFIGSIGDTSRLEVMVNEYCTPGCPWRAAHYRAVSEAQLAGRQCDFSCRHEPGPQAHGFLQGLIDGDVFLHNRDVCAYADELGVGYFKIVGRGLDRYDVIDALLYYLVQPDCWYELRDFLVRHDYL